MIKDITLGQFFPGNSPVHKIDARVKIVIAMIFIASIFSASNVYSIALVFSVTAFVVLLSRVSIVIIIKGLKPVLFILIFTTVIQVFITRSGELWVKLWIIQIYSDGVIFAVKMIIRIVLLIVSTSVLLSYTTSPIVITDGIEGLLYPLAKAGVNVHDFAMMMSIALRFIPTLVEETDKIMSAQKARGTDFTSGGLIKRAKSMIPIFVPLLFSAIRRAEELSCAMICRCYRGGEGRTKLKALKTRPFDFVWLTVALLILAAVIAINIVL